MSRVSVLLSITSLLSLLLPAPLSACSTFKLQSNGELIYAHNLDRPERDMPGMICVNTRGSFKVGRSFSEMFFDRNRSRPSDLCWISRYGSVTCAIYGRDFPDGGINEAGIFVWEMGLVGTDCPHDEMLPRRLKMNWMQYILDTCGTLDEAVQAAYEIEIEGWQWHFFLGDGRGDCATVEFLDGEVVIHRGENMPIPALFNQPHEVDMGTLGLFKGFGGLYEPDLNDPRVSRIAKAATMLRDYDPDAQEALEHAKTLLYHLGNKPYKWGVLIDVARQRIHFNTEAHQEWKSFSLHDLEFSAGSPVMTLNIDPPQEGDVSARFHRLEDSEFKTVFRGSVDDLPDQSLTHYGVDRATLIGRFAAAYHEAERLERQYFRGTWKGECTEADEEGVKEPLMLELTAEGSAVSGAVVFRGERYSIQHLRLVGRRLSFSFRTSRGSIVMAQGLMSEGFLDLSISWTEGRIGDFLLHRG